MKTISHYSLGRKLGSGGMGEVFLAEDLTLGRKVALKLLPEQFTADRLRLGRFQKEARVVSALNHPNILTIFEVGEADGQHFIVMEFIDGMTLRDRMQRGRVPLLEVLDMAMGVASALAEAHAAGVVHRDIKPENIMVRRDGLVKVLDFGLAKRVEPSTSGESATAIRQTAPGTVLGTVTYMSPEQARGLEVDARTDLFSLGAVLYEALTGHVPFEGATSTDILAAILHREPAPIQRYTADVPRELQWLVEKALHKDRDERYQTAKEMFSDLRRIRREIEGTPYAESTGGASAAHDVQKASTSGSLSAPDRKAVSSAEFIVSGIRTHKKSVATTVIAIIAIAVAAIYLTTGKAKAIDSVAVLPFANTSGDSGAEYLADGMTENLINSLTGISGLRVVPRSSVFRYKGSDLAVEDIAKKLGVRAILMGRVQQRGDSLTVQAELVDAAAQSQIWGERFEARLNDVMSIERQLAHRAAAKLRPGLTGEEQARVEKPITTDAQAHDLYLKGRFHWNKRKVADIRKALDYFQLAVDRDPNFALAWAAIAETYVVLPTYDTTVMSRDAYPKARQAAERALQIDQGIAEAHAALAAVFFEYEWDMAAAEREFKKAIELKPNYAAAHYWYADYLAAQLRYDEALQHSRTAREADPLSPVALASLPFQLVQQGDYDGALREIRPLEELEPEDWRIHVIHAEVALARGHREEAVKHLAKLSQSGSERGRFGWLLANGQRAEAEALAKTLANLASQNEYSAFRVAMFYAKLGDVDETVRWLKHAHAIRSGDLRYIKRESSFDGLYDDPQFLAALKNMGFNEKLPKRLQVKSRLAASPERGH